MNSATARTRLRILENAERLFAVNGIDQASIRQINLAAGQRNASATQYHFGSKAALVEAILEHRAEAINDRRLAALRKLDPDLSDDNLRPLIEALVYPLADEMGPNGEYRYYIQTVAQIIGHPEYEEIARNRNQHGDGMKKIFDRLMDTLPHLPKQILRQRFGMAIRKVFHDLADYQRLHSRGISDADTAVFLNNLIDVITAQFTAPVSEETRRVLDAQNRKTA